jgi:hypothetical protein
MNAINTNLNQKNLVPAIHETIHEPEKMTSQLEKLIGEVEANITQYGLSPTFNTVEEFMAGLK